MIGVLSLFALLGAAASVWSAATRPAVVGGEAHGFAAAAFVGAVAGAWASLIVTTAWVVMS